MIEQGHLPLLAGRDTGRARISKHPHHRHKHQHRAKERVEEELERSINPVRPAPDANDQEHRDQASLKEQVEQDQIQRHEHAKHQRFKQQKRDHVFFDAMFHVPARQNNQRHHEGGKHHKQDGYAINTQTVLHAQQPFGFNHELHAGIVWIKLKQHKQGHHKGDRGGDHREPLGIALRRFIVSTQEDGQDQRRKSGHERNDGKKMCIHQRLPPSKKKYKRITAETSPKPKASAATPHSTTRPR